MKKNIIRRAGGWLQELYYRINPPQCTCGFPAEFLVTNPKGRREWLCDAGLEELCN